MPDPAPAVPDPLTVSTAYALYLLWFAHARAAGTVPDGKLAVVAVDFEIAAACFALGAADGGGDAPAGGPKERHRFRHAIAALLGRDPWGDAP